MAHKKWFCNGNDANITVKRDCNCSNGGLWLDQRVDNRIRVASRHNILDVPVSCSCSQVAMYAGTVCALPGSNSASAAQRQ